MGSSPRGTVPVARAATRRTARATCDPIQHADDSAGLIGDLARELLALHARACDSGVADPVKPAAWMIRFRFDDQDFFEVDPVRYASALGGEVNAPKHQAICVADMSARRRGGRRTSLTREIPLDIAPGF